MLRERALGNDSLGTNYTRAVSASFDQSLKEDYTTLLP